MHILEIGDVWRLCANRRVNRRRRFHYINGKWFSPLLKLHSACNVLSRIPESSLWQTFREAREEASVFFCFVRGAWIGVKTSLHLPSTRGRENLIRRMNWINIFMNECYFFASASIHPTEGKSKIVQWLQSSERLVFVMLARLKW